MIRRSLAAALVCGWSAACTGAPETPAESVAATTLEAPAGLGLQSTPLPDVSTMGEDVQRQMRGRFAALREATARVPPDKDELAAAYGDVGNILLAARYYAMSEPYYSNAHTLAPSDARWSYYLGQVYRNTGPLEEASKFLEQVREAQPDDLATLVGLGEVYLALGRFEDAAARFDEAAEREPASSAVWFGIGRVALARDDTDTAVEALEKALAGDPRATAIHYPLALAHRAAGDTDQAEIHLDQRGDVAPRPADPLMRALDDLLESPEVFGSRGRSALANGNFSAAADLFARGLELEPGDAFLRHDLATALYRMGDLGAAETEFERVIQTDPRFASAYYSLGELMTATGRPQEAVDTFSLALRYEPGHIQARVRLAGVLGRSGQPQEALVQFARVLELDPLQAEAMLGTAMNLVRLNRYQEARDRLSEGLRAFPERSSFAFALARLQAAAPDERVRDGESALRLAEQLLAEERSFGLGETLAMSLAELGRYPAAVAVQRDLLGAASQAGAPAMVTQRLTEHLRLYERGEPCREPFGPDEMF